MEQIRIITNIATEDLAIDLDRQQAEELTKFIDEYQCDWDFTYDMAKYFLSQLETLFMESGNIGFEKLTINDIMKHREKIFPEDD